MAAKRRMTTARRWAGVLALLVLALQLSGVAHSHVAHADASAGCAVCHSMGHARLSAPSVQATDLESEGCCVPLPASRELDIPAAPDTSSSGPRAPPSH